MSILKGSNTAIIDEATLAASATTALGDCTAVDCTKGTQLVFFVEATFNASATAGIDITLWPSYDGTTFVTSAWSDWTWSIAVDAGNSIVECSEPISPTPQKIKVKVTNSDATYAVTNLKVYHNIQTAG